MDLSRDRLHDDDDDDDITRIMSWKGCRRKTSMPNLRWYSDSCLEGLKSTSKSPSEWSVCGPRIEFQMSYLRSRILTHSPEMFHSTMKFLLLLRYILPQNGQEPEPPLHSMCNGCTRSTCNFVCVNCPCHYIFFTSTSTHIYTEKLYPVTKWASKWMHNNVETFIISIRTDGIP